MTEIRTTDTLPRLPLEGSIDLTYRCNNACLHCWLWTGDTAEERARELTTEEWRTIVDQARASASFPSATVAAMRSRSLELRANSMQIPVAAESPISPSAERMAGHSRS